MLKALFVAVLLICTNLPIPVRSQSPSPSGDGNSSTQVQFPGTSISCSSCKPAFDSQVCQPVLKAISQPKTESISNSTLVNCQCSSLFISLFQDCVECFTETDQLDLVFGNSKVPSQSRLVQFCNSKSSSHLGVTNDIKPTTATTMTTQPSITVTTTTGTALPTFTKPSSGTVLKPSFIGEDSFSVNAFVILIALSYSTSFL